ncbi:hypothetical protein N7466_006510 [Penicillium verhagenii]|uniref:uncharacterized protein n=1 Tax=Penicillium verhagenii TaxID=1562060 RepID=UPI0025450558|nr:uncharacterized protein N7466_006510 [Penicillium verhagenii]KAJ5931017.1 hypothetical protein N7466_006510 [Penicillium verhagenii]
MQTLSANGGTYTEAWRTNPNGGGISVKLSTQPDQSDVLQFEYTEFTDTIYWDLFYFSTSGPEILPAVCARSPSTPLPINAVALRPWLYFLSRCPLFMPAWSEIRLRALPNPRAAAIAHHWLVHLQIPDFEAS